MERKLGGERISELSCYSLGSLHSSQSYPQPAFGIGTGLEMRAEKELAGEFVTLEEVELYSSELLINDLTELQSQCKFQCESKK